MGESSWNFDNGFIGWIADYIQDVTEDERRDVIESWKDSFKEFSDYIDMGENTILFKTGFKDAYAEMILKTLKSISEEADVAYIRTGRTRLYLETLFGDPFGTYLYTDFGLVRENIWLTEYLVEDTPYIFGNVIDYHY